MATRANIIVETAPARFEVIYTHSDGYPSYMGVYLDRFHNTEKAAKKIVDLGDMSFLEARLEPAPGEGHGFDIDKRAAFCSVFYKRDREPKELSHCAAFYPSLKEALDDCDHYAVYVWLKGSGWHFSLVDPYPVKPFHLKPLTDFVREDADCQKHIAYLDNEGQTVEWRDAGCPAERVQKNGHTRFEVRPIGWVQPLTPQQVMAQRYFDEAVF